ncbi:ferredoxin [Streptomyces sp. NPDC018045]|uniref:ferredoxin n=1 Tax=Streptomyces sp. NPDC018045 TaxID=3365037 RepID=UPI0037A0D8BE
MELSVDRDRCHGAGMCALTAPALFDQDTEDGRVRLLDPRPPREHHAGAREAAWLCPAATITVTEEDENASATP